MEVARTPTGFPDSVSRVPGRSLQHVTNFVRQHAAQKRGEGYALAVVIRFHPVVEDLNLNAARGPGRDGHQDGVPPGEQGCKEDGTAHPEKEVAPPPEEVGEAARRALSDGVRQDSDSPQAHHRRIGGNPPGRHVLDEQRHGHGEIGAAELVPGITEHHHRDRDTLPHKEAGGPEPV